MAEADEKARLAASNTGEPDMVNEYDGEEFWTKYGLSWQSFQKKHYGKGVVELDRVMKPRHMQMIAIGGAIGTGLFVGSGSALAKGGPASLLICFLLMGFVVFNVGGWPWNTSFVD